ncbi:MAG: alpha-L-rhamnosidase C-terminal domain-containing protein, partial [Prevotellaceae bacterium]|nr:alpha-L-rhamnosidase C-terminal domain-containing protein [Prevotellaceae bacterium]
LGHVCARFSSVYGDITSMWTSQKPSKEASASRYGYTYHAIVPANTTATLTLSLRQEGNIIIKEGNKGIKSVKTLSDRVVYELSSGRYAFQIQ